MGKEIRTRLYIAGVGVAGVAVTAIAAARWPAGWDTSSVLTMLIVAGLVCLLDRHPIKLSPQADASLFTVPMFAGVLLLHPAQAALAAGVGLLASEAIQRRPLKPLLLNVSAAVLAAGLAGTVFTGLAPHGATTLLQGQMLLAALAAGLTQELTNLMVMAGIVSVRKGSAFWGVWKGAWAFETIQQMGGLVLGFVAVVLASIAVWSVLLPAVPLGLVYVAFRRSVAEVRRSTELAERNAALARELELKLEELQETQAQLIMHSEKVTSVGLTAASVVHEVKNAMCVTAGRAEILLRHPGVYFKSEKAMEHVRNISEMTRRVTTITQELLAYARQDTTRKPVDLPRQMELVADLVGRRAVSQGITIEKDYQEVPQVLGIENQLQQVFMNLLINSIDATPSGGTITLGCRQEEGTVTAFVKDTGAGIPESVLAKMFEPLYTTKEAGKGTGLGMFVCKRIVSAHGGEIEVRSREGEGTEVTIRLPAIAPVEQKPHSIRDHVSLALAEVEPGLRVALRDAVPAA